MTAGGGGRPGGPGSGAAGGAPATGVGHIVPCRGGPSWMGWLRVDDPLPLEVRHTGGTYVLECDPSDQAGDHRACRDHWYVWLPDG